jgi:hypothetical protein
VSEWWKGPRDGGTLLSRRFVQAFVFPLPGLKRAELESTLRYKVRTILPVQTDAFAFRTRLFRNAGQTFGAAFLATGDFRDLGLPETKPLRLGFPLAVPAGWGPKAILFVASPEGVEAHLYEAGVLKTSFAPFPAQETKLVQRLLDLYRDARVFSWSPDGRCDLPEGAWEPTPPTILSSCPLWEQPAPRRTPVVLGAALLAVGLALSVAAATGAITQREHRNEIWKEWLKKAGAVPISTSAPQALVQAIGFPVPEVFTRLGRIWPSGTRIESLQWTPGKLILVARSSSALRSLQALTADSWFRSLRVDDIHTLKDGGEQFTVEGALNLDH